MRDATDIFRGLICLTAGAASAFGVGISFSGPASAQTFPSKPVRIVVGFAPGGPSDIISRLVGTKMSEILGHQFVIENKAGAGGVIAIETVGRSDPDGYTILNTPLGNAVNETLSANLKFKVGNGMVAIAPLAETANVLVVHPTLGVKNVADLIQLAKSKPGEILYATAGRGSATHLASELFNMMAGTKLKPIHYKGGGDALKDLLSGEVKVMISSIAPVLGFIRNGQLIGLATTGPKRDATLPDLQTLSESGLSGYDVRLWQGFTGPAGIPRPVIEKLANTTAQALNAPEIKDVLTKQGFSPMTGTPDQFDAFYRSEVAKWRKVVETSGMNAQ
jgi:tripartite-type tricarboxylate transporter receptor subunit TctC